MLYAFFWVITLRLNFIWRRFGPPCLFRLHTNKPMKMEQTGFSETSAYIIQTKWKYPEESTKQMYLLFHMIRHLRCVFIKYIGMYPISNATIWWNRYVLFMT